MALDITVFEELLQGGLGKNKPAGDAQAAKELMEKFSEYAASGQWHLATVPTYPLLQPIGNTTLPAAIEAGRVIFLPGFKAMSATVWVGAFAGAIQAWFTALDLAFCWGPDVGPPVFSAGVFIPAMLAALKLNQKTEASGPEAARRIALACEAALRLTTAPQISTGTVMLYG